jgi:PAS domain S-box-containing protein
MKIKTQFIISTLIFGVILLVMIAALVFTNQRLQETSQQLQIATNLQQEANELSYMVNDYLIYQENQQLTRWETGFAAFSNGLAMLKPGTPEQQTLTSNLQTNQQQLQNVFSDIQATLAKTAATQGAAVDPAFIRTSWSRLEVQNQGLIFNTSRLSQALTDQDNQLKQNVNLLIIILVVIFGVFVLVNYFLNYRRTIKSLAVLQSGTRIIGSGNLDYKLTEKGNDEISDLSRAFNHMSASLKTVTASKTDLEREITERKKAEEALQKTLTEVQANKARLETFLLTSPSAIVIIEKPDGKVSFINERARELYGMDPRGLKMEEYPKIGLLKLDGTPYTPEEMPASRSLFKGAVVRGEDLILARPNGTQVVVSASSAPVRNSQGEITSVIGIFEDITDRKKAEEDLKKYTHDLELANKELEAFSYSVSHDLRAPLRGIDGFSNVLLDDYRDKLDEQGQDYLDRIRKSSQLMSQLIDGILKLSRITRAEVHTEKVNLSNIVRSIAEEMKQSQPERKAEFIITPEIIAFGDKVLLEALLQNLLENAWKFTGKCQQTRIEFGTVQKDKVMVYYVRDNGIGFDMKYSDKLFKPFNRLHNQNEYQGTGIGLANVQKIVSRHGGRIWAESEISKGATFYFTLGI